MMARRRFLHDLAGAGLLAGTGAGWDMPLQAADPKGWLQIWQTNLLKSARSRYCDTDMGEEIAWLISPFLNAFYYGWLVTRDRQWVQMFVDWSDSWIKRRVPEPDGFVGWPKTSAAGTDIDGLNSFSADSLLGEAMALCPIVLMSGELHRDPALQADYSAKAASYLQLSGQIFEKWDQRGAWRDLPDGKGIWINLPSAWIPLRKNGQSIISAGTRLTWAFLILPIKPMKSPAGIWPCLRPRVSRFTRNGRNAGSAS